MASVTNFIGKDIWVRTTNGDEYTGELFCYDMTDSNSFIIRQRSADGKANYAWIKTSIVRELKALHPDADQQTADQDIASLPPIDLFQIEEAERKGEEYFASMRDSFGVGVSQEAQEVFDSLAKTMPCRWSQQDIRCYEVTIAAPYTPDNCRGGSDAAELTRVKKVLEGVRAKMTRRTNSRFSNTSSEIEP